MARPNRIKLDGEGYYHVIDRIAHREFLLRDERIKKRLIDLVRRAAEFSGVDVCTCVIMDNHLHLCARGPGPLRNRHGNRHEGPVPISGRLTPGMRGLSPLTYWEASKEDPLVIIQLEHIDAVRNLDEILAVPGIGAVVIGPYDLSASMGKEGQWHDSEVSAVYDESCRKVRETGILLGVYTECDFDVWRRRGVQFMAIKNDTNAMLLGYQKMRAMAQAGQLVRGQTLYATDGSNN